MPTPVPDDDLQALGDALAQSTTAASKIDVVRLDQSALRM
jgi:hypothetical protein